MNKKGKTQRGITLIALVITIIVMLILVGVTISMAVNGGLFNYAQNAVGETKNAINAEQDLGNGGITIGGKYYNSIDEYLNKDKGETISKETSYVGYYADVDGNGTVDGVIYADLAIGGNVQWSQIYMGEEFTYTIPTRTGLKDYYISKTSYEGDFGTNDVLTPTGTGNERFYVMALSDISTSEYTWYSAQDDGESEHEVVTSHEFGTGKSNTDIMIGIWNANTELQSESDVWGQIQEQVDKGWFVPSSYEWSEFGRVVLFDGESEPKYQLSGNYYWTSSMVDSFGRNYCEKGFIVGYGWVSDFGPVRLSCMF